MKMRFFWKLKVDKPYGFTQGAIYDIVDETDDVYILKGYNLMIPKKDVKLKEV